MTENTIWDVDCFFNMLLYYLFAEFAVSLNARNLKNRDFPSGKCIFFIKSNFSRSMFKDVENESKNNGLGKRKDPKNQ